MKTKRHRSPAQLRAMHDWNDLRRLMVRKGWRYSKYFSAWVPRTPAAERSE